MKSDAVLLAEAILYSWQDYDDGDYSPAFYHCVYCTGKHQRSYNDVKHDIYCPVLVAKDVMTGQPEEESNED